MQQEGGKTGRVAGASCKREPGGAAEEPCEARCGDPPASFLRPSRLPVFLLIFRPAAKLYGARGSCLLCPQCEPPSWVLRSLVWLPVVRARKRITSRHRTS